MRFFASRAFWLGLSAVFFCCAIVWSGFLISDEARVQKTTNRLLAQTNALIGAAAPDTQRVPDHVLDPAREMPIIEVENISVVASISFPTIGLELPVANEWSYELLRDTPCRYSGTPYQAPMVILGHNYTRHFGRLSTLSIGDKVQLTDAQGYVFTYTVQEKETLPATAVKEVTLSDWDLTLFTCDLSGNSRFTVRLSKDA